MQSPPVLELDRLAAPISDDAPTGVELRTADETAYWAVKDTYTKARSIEASLAKGNDPDPDNPLDWQGVLDACTQALAEKTKDLEIAAYLLVAAFRVHGVAGLRDGFCLVRTLVESYWDNLYPPLDVEGTSPDGEPITSPATRVTTLGGVNSKTLVEMLKELPVARSHHDGDFSFVQYKDALRKRDASLDAIRQAAAETDAAYYRPFAADVKACQEEFRQMTAALDARCGKESPASTAMAELLRELNEYVTTLAGDKLKEPESADGQSEGDGQVAGAAPARGGTFSASDVLKTREEAFNTLRKVAGFFRQTDPHSFLAYALERVIRWGEMPLPKLLEELISGDDSRREVFRLVGIEPDKPPEESSYS
jgi:type VI secretion system protein ImpA